MSGNSEILGHHDCDHRTSGVCSTGPLSAPVVAQAQSQCWNALMFEMFPDFGGRMKAQVNHSSGLKCSKFSETEPWDRNTTRQHKNSCSSGKCGISGRFLWSNRYLYFYWDFFHFVMQHVRKQTERLLLVATMFILVSAYSPKGSNLHDVTQ